MTPIKQLALIILDGWGYSKENKYNAIHLAHPEYFKYLWDNYPHALFQASGEAVGLMPGVIGTSEIGHLTIGSGRIIDTDVVRVNKAISSGEIEKNPVLNELFSHVKQYDSTLHFMGLLSPGAVHAYQDHLFAFLKLAKAQGIKKMVVHVFLDGRDVPPKSGIEYIKDLEAVLAEIGEGRIATLSGRYYAMDRDTNWDRTDLAAQALLEGKGRVVKNVLASDELESIYKENETDEFVKPTVILDANGQASVISKNDGLLFYNFRPDRARQISEVILKKEKELNLYFATLTEYSKDIKTHVLFAPLEIKTSLSEELSEHDVTQVHIAETEKYAHVTYFLNGGNENKHKGEEFVLIPSRKDVPTHDLAPDMKAKEIADAAIDYINRGTGFIAINFANADMVGHSGKLEPTIEAIKCLDVQIKRVVEALLAREGAAFITADHGNAEQLFDEKTGQPKTSHTLNPVPGILTIKGIELKEGGLADIAPTILALYGIPKPSDMTGQSLIVNN